MRRDSDRHRIVFRCDASETFGGGHVMRCLTLANAMAEEVAEITFVAASMSEALRRRIADGGHKIELISASPELQRDGPDWEMSTLGLEAQRADADETGRAAGRSDWIIVDHYLLDANWHSAARHLADRILVIDDLANRSYDCDILLDQTFGRLANDYHELVPSGARVLAGSSYALLRPEFARERPAALERRKNGSPVRRILVSIGTSDPGGITARLVERVLNTAPDCAIDVVLGPQATSLQEVKSLAARNPGIAVHIDSDRMAELMRDADIAIGAAGTTSWERCCLGLPAITLVLAENQSLIADRLALAGAHILIAVGDEQSLAVQLREVISSLEVRQRMTESGARITDGLGSTRVRAAIKSMNTRELFYD